MDKELIKQQVYEYYESLLLGEPAKIPNFLSKELKGDQIIYLEKKDLVLCGNPICPLEIRLKGTTYISGEIVKSEQVESLRSILVRIGKEGIYPLEEYSGKGFKPVFLLPDDKGLIFNLDSIEKNITHKEFKNRTLEEVIRVNLHYFSDLRKRFPVLGEDGYMAEYLKALSEHPIFF